MVQIFQARHGTMAYSSSAVTWDTSTKASSETFTANVNEMRDVTITFPEVAVEVVNCIGASTQTIGANQVTSGSSIGINQATFQNQMLERKAVTGWKMSGTVVMQGDEEFFHILGFDAGSAIASNSTRYSFGNITVGGANAWNQLGSLRMFLNNGTQEVNVVMTNVQITKFGDLKPAGPDSFWQCDLEAECLSQDGVLEFKN